LNLNGSLVSFDERKLVDLRGAQYRIYSRDISPRHLGLDADWVTLSTHLSSRELSSEKATLEEFEQDLFNRLRNRDKGFDFRTFANNFRRWLRFSHLPKSELESASQRVIRRLEYPEDDDPQMRYPLT
jgi:hypothetical protein